MVALNGDTVVCGLKNFSFSYSWPRNFVQSQWATQKPHPWFPIYRFFIMAYWTSWLIYDFVLQQQRGNEEAKFFIYLTHWGAILEAIYFIYSFVMSILFYNLQSGDMEKTQWSGITPMSLRIQWILHTTVATASVVVFGLYWSLLYNPETSTNDAANIHMHAVNFALILLDLFIIASPIRLQHFYVPSLFGLAYGIFTIIYAYSGGINYKNENFVYSVLDYKNNATKAYIYLGIVVFVATPAGHLIIWGLTWLRITCARQIGTGGGGKVSPMSDLEMDATESGSDEYNRNDK